VALAQIVGMAAAITDASEKSVADNIFLSESETRSPTTGMIHLAHQLFFI